MTTANAGLDRETLELTLEAIGEFAAELLPAERLLELDHADEFPVEVVRAMCGDELGVQLLFIPEEYGGMGGGAFDVYRVCEKLARIDLGVATGVLATFLGSDPIIVGGTAEQQRHWMTRIAEEGLLMAYGATEPEAGSDLGALRTRAEPVMEDGAARRLPDQRRQAVDQQRRLRRSLQRSGPGPGRTELVRRRARASRASAGASPRTSTASVPRNTAAVNFDDVVVTPTG